MVRTLKETNNIVLYKGNDGELELAFKFDSSDSFMGVNSKCDLCGVHSKHYHTCPELGSKGLCDKCFTEHRKNVKWYQEDMTFIFDMTICIVVCRVKVKVSKFDLTDEELDLIDHFFEEHSNHAIPIRKFIERYGDSDGK